MKLQDQVVPLQMAKRLKELGVSQESLFYWWDLSEIKDRLIDRTDAVLTYGKFSPAASIHTSPEQFVKVSYGAFTVAELGVMLPTEAISGIKSFGASTDKWNPKDDYGYGIWHYTSDDANLWRWRLPTQTMDEQDSPKRYATEAEARASMLIHLLESNLTSAEEVNKKLKK